jgi:SRSO17 transposase
MFKKQRFPLSKELVRYIVRYEPFCISWSRGDPSATDAKVSSYNVDFAVRRRDGHKVVGIEVKNDWDAWKWREEDALAKLKMYEDTMGAPCLVLIMSPEPVFYLDNDQITHEQARMVLL